MADLLLLSALFFIGHRIASQQIPSYNPQQAYLIHGRCKEILTNHHHILSIGDWYFYLNHRYTDTLYSPGDSLSFYAHIRPFNYRSNPGEFSYARYLKQKQVFHQLIPVTAIQKIGFSHDIPSFFYQLREKIMQKTARLTSDTTCQQLINALCLGYKVELEEEIRQLFTTTGTIHLLSVSGLHTGALYLLFLFILRKLGFKRRKAELWLLPFLFGYACLTGLSPSVVRASTILSFIAIGKAFNRNYIPLNSLCAAAFLTLIIDPTALYSMSFLLSYSAYAGILIFYPLLFHLPGKLPPLLSKLYASCCITLAAQLPTLPLGAYFFHSINLNGFLANLIAVPIATLFLYSTAICLLLPLWISQSLHSCYEFLGRLLIRFLQFFAPYSINLQHLYPSSLTIIFIYLCLIATTLLLLHPQKRWMRVNLICYCTLLLFLIGQQLHFNAIQEVVILHYPQQSVILFQYRGYCIPLRNTLDTSLHHHPYVRKYRSTLFQQHTGFLDNTVFCIGNQLHHPQDTLLILSQGNKYYSSCSILIINENLTPQEVFPEPTSTLPKRIILDGSNHRKALAKWQIFCKKHSLILQTTAENGFISIPLK